MDNLSAKLKKVAKDSFLFRLFIKLLLNKFRPSKNLLFDS